MPSDPWLRLNSHRAYPLDATTVSAAGSGAATVPGTALLDCGFIVGPSGDLGPAGRVRLTAVRRLGSSFYFDFAADTAVLASRPITFVRPVSATAVLTSFEHSAGPPGTLGYSRSYADCNEAVWEGFLTTGDLTDLAALLPANGSLAGGAGVALVEVGCVQDLSASRITSLAVANLDRTLATAPSGCSGSTPLTPQYRIVTPCITGPVRFAAGYNAVVQQDSAANALIFGASSGRGAGLPCADVPAYPGEAVPAGSIYLDGSLACNQTLRSVNGAGGPNFDLTSGGGIAVVPGLTPHTLNLTVTAAVPGACAATSVSAICHDSRGIG